MEIKLDQRPKKIDGTYFETEAKTGELLSIALLGANLGNQATEVKLKLIRYNLAKKLKGRKSIVISEEELEILKAVVIINYNVEMAGVLTEILEDDISIPKKVEEK